MRLESAVYISRPHGSWMDPSNWNSKYPTPIPHTQQVYIYISPVHLVPGWILQAETQNIKLQSHTQQV